MIYSFELLLPPFSVNRYYYASKKIKTKEAREWEVMVQKELQPHEELLAMASAHKRDSGTFSVKFTFEYPKHIFYNKAGQVSAKTMDLSNVEKPLIDQIFLAFMDIDDRSITSLESTKRSGNGYKILIDLKLHTNIE